MPDQTTRVEAAIEQAMHKISGTIGMYAGQVISHNTALHEIQQEIVKILRESGIDQTAESAPSAESVGRAMLALPHLAAADVLAVARLIDAAKGATPYDQAQAWAAETTKIHAMYAGDIKALQGKLDAARGAQLSDQADRLARAIDRLESGQIGFSEDKQRSIIMAGERVSAAADKLDSLYTVCMQLAEDMAPSVMPVVEAVQMLIDRDARHEQGVRNLQALGASLAEIDDYESRAFDVAAQVKRLGWPLDYITIAAFDEPEPQEDQRPEAKPGSLESRRVQLIELGQKGSDVDRFVADVLDKMIEICAAGYKMKAGNTWPITIPTPEHAGVYVSSDVRVALARLIDQWGLNNLANQFNMPPKELQGIVYGDDLIPERIARKAGFEPDGQNWRKITYE